MTDALTTLESWMKGLRMSLTDAALALHGTAVPKAVPPEALAKLRCALFATTNALDELVDQLKGPGAGEQEVGREGRRAEGGRQSAATR